VLLLLAATPVTDPPAVGSSPAAAAAAAVLGAAANELLEACGVMKDPWRAGWLLKALPWASRSNTAQQDTGRCSLSQLLRRLYCMLWAIV
jgi:hypothetical protein